MTGTWVASALLAALCGAIVPPDSVPFTALDGGVQSGIEKARTVMVRTAAEWKTLCGQYADARPCPAVDFAQSTVVGVFLGSRSTAGFAVEIVRIARDGEALVVSYKEKAPGPGEMAAQMMTAPYQLVTIGRVDGAVRVVRSQQIR